MKENQGVCSLRDSLADESFNSIKKQNGKISTFSEYFKYGTLFANKVDTSIIITLLWLFEEVNVRLQF